MMDDFEKYFVLFSTCIVVNGFNRSLILDLQRETFVAIPNSMTEIIELLNSKKNIGEIIKIYGVENHNVIDEYLTFLVDNEYGFVTDSLDFDNFPPMNKTFEIPSIITNSIVEISLVTLNNIEKIVQNLSDLNCNDIQFISYGQINLNDFILLLEESNKSEFRSIELILKYSDEVFEFLPQVTNLNKRVTEILFHSSRDNKIIPETNFSINFLNYEIQNFNFCGVVKEKNFNQVNKERVLESINHNSCLHKKIAIDQAGIIKNCPALNQSFGNIQDITLRNAVTKNSFMELWNITKDQISVCKDCEFRHVCTDCRAFLENPNDKYSKPLKCGYNPYDNTWQEWSTNPLKQKVINYYNME